MNITASDLLSIKHVEQIGLDKQKALKIAHVSTDSRTTKPGDVFFALRGENFNGHDFLTKAVELGAAAVVVEAEWSKLNPTLLSSLQAPRLVVESTVMALGELARLYRRKFKIPLLTVGGSSGKTTTKDMIAAVLKMKFNVLSTEGNLNNHIGVPLTLFRLEKKHQIAVIEMGTNHFAEIRYLTEIVQPTRALITNIGSEHLEFFGDLAGVARAETEVFDWMKEQKSKPSVVFIHRDDQLLERDSKGMKKRVTYGFSAKSVDVKGKILELTSDACAKLSIRPKGKSAFDVLLAVPGYHNALNALAAATVGLHFKVPGAKIQKALQRFCAPAKRMQVMRMNGVTILNDTYNSNPDSAIAALQTLGAIKVSGKKIAVLADMLELGKNAEEAHRRVSEAVARCGIEYLLTHGPLSKLTHDAASVKFKAHYDQKNMLAEYLAELVTNGDAVLVKGSRGMKMESIVTFLFERFKQAA